MTLKYPHSFFIGPALRPHIKVEFTFSDILLPREELRIKTIMEDNFKEINLFEPPTTQCISIDETAIEKWVSLTRRVMAIERKHEDDDKTLIRHIYDLNAINETGKINSKFMELTKITIINDGKQFKSRHPEYATDPMSEIKQSLSLLNEKSIWKERYEEFIETMVYGSLLIPSYKKVLKTLEDISSKIIEQL